MRGHAFGFETLLVSGSVVAAAHLHGSLDNVMGTLWKVVLVTALCELCFDDSDLYDLNQVHAKGELIIRVLQGTGAAAIWNRQLSRDRCRRYGWAAARF